MPPRAVVEVRVGHAALLAQGAQGVGVVRGARHQGQPRRRVVKRRPVLVGGGVGVAVVHEHPHLEAVQRRGQGVAGGGEDRRPAIAQRLGHEPALVGVEVERDQPPGRPLGRVALQRAQQQHRAQPVLDPGLDDHRGLELAGDRVPGVAAAEAHPALEVEAPAHPAGQARAQHRVLARLVEALGHALGRDPERAGGHVDQLVLVGQVVGERVDLGVEQDEAEHGERVAPQRGAVRAGDARLAHPAQPREPAQAAARVAREQPAQALLDHRLASTAA